MHHVSDIAKGLHIKWDRQYDEGYEKLFYDFLHQLEKENSRETLENLEFEIKDKKICIKTTYQYWKKSNQFMLIKLVGGRYIGEVRKSKPNSIRQPVYRLSDHPGVTRDVVDWLNLEVNYLKVELI